MSLHEAEIGGAVENPIEELGKGMPRLSGLVAMIKAVRGAVDTVEQAVNVLEGRMGAFEEVTAGIPAIGQALTSLKSSVGLLQDGLTSTGKAVAALQNQVETLSSVDVLAALANATEVKLGKAGGRVGFYGKTPVVRPAALPVATATVATSIKIGNTDVLTAGTKVVIDNHTARLNQIEAVLKGYGLLP